MVIRRTLLTALVVTAISTVLIEPAIACQCAIGLTPQSNIDGAPKIFSGKVVEVLPGPADGRGHMLLAKIDVLERWKGAVADQVTVYGSTSGSSCGYHKFPLGEVITLFAFSLRPQDQTYSVLKTNFCLMEFTEQPATIGMLRKLRDEQGGTDAGPANP